MVFSSRCGSNRKPNCSITLRGVWEAGAIHNYLLAGNLLKVARRRQILLSVAAVAMAQTYDGGFVKILQDKRYQSGSTFGNFRDQEDGTKYFEETDELGVRRGYWEYVDELGKTIRNEFEAGPGIGFRITKSNAHDTTPVHRPQPQFQPPRPAPTAAPVYQPVPVQPTYQPVAVQPQYQPLPVHVPAPAPIPTYTPSLAPEPQNLFDYPGNLEFSRDHLGHRFKFVAA
ncbi:hypothetical protein E2C01_032270 [Portunus trituberculatus]|uniref:Cuticle protein 6 n=1 Tax=Portunus trituberculatus TaxID=210409 RepID=A0A5B7F0B4_PORTR|nr:hypothetical protein [Portunus trituberculatus]